MTTKAERIAASPFFVKPIATPEEEWRLVNLESLFAFYRHPPKFFLRERLGIRLPNDKSLLEEREPFELGSLGKYQIQQELAMRLLAGEQCEDEEALVRASGQLPAGESGRIRFCEVQRTVAQFVETIRAQIRDGELQSWPVEIRLDDWKLSGRIDGVTDTGLFCFRLAKAKSLDLIRSWIYHLALNLSKPTRTLLITQGAIRTYQEIDPKGSRELLADFLQIYAEGLVEPLPFFARASLAFAEQTFRPSGRKSPLEKALEPWDGNHEGEFAEKADPYNALAFRNVRQPLDEKWQALSLRIFIPLLRNSEVTES
jgi:exodeoxyribonuclease V gamma subunit